MSGSGVNEFSGLVAGIVQASQAAAGNSEGVDVTDLITTWSPLIARARDASVADALDAQATFYWEASTLLDPAKTVADLQGEESMSAILDAQIRTMREVSNRLRRRAAEWRGLPPEDQAIHEMAAGGVTPAAPPAAAAAVAGPLTAVMGEIVAAYLVEHPELDPARDMISFEFREGESGWYVAGHILIQHPPGLPVPPAAPDCACACCLVGDGLCYCEGPKAKMCKCGPCKKAREDMK